MKKINWIGVLAIIMVIAGLIYEYMYGGISSAGQFAHGYFAAGQFAMGVFAAGTFSIGVFSVGLFSVGIFSASIFNVGIYGLGFFIWAYKKRALRLKEESS